MQLGELQEIIAKVSDNTKSVQNQFEVIFDLTSKVRQQEAVIKNAMDEQNAGSAEITKAVQACLNISSQNHDNLDSLQQEVNIFKVN